MKKTEGVKIKKDYKIVDAVTGNVGLFFNILISKFHQVFTVDILSEEVDLINN